MDLRATATGCEHPSAFAFSVKRRVFNMAGAGRARLLVALHCAAVNRVEETDKRLRNVAAEVFRDRHKPGPPDALALIELDQKLDREKRRLARIAAAMDGEPVDRQLT